MIRSDMKISDIPEEYFAIFKPWKLALTTWSGCAVIWCSPSRPFSALICICTLPKSSQDLCLLHPPRLLSHIPECIFTVPRHWMAVTPTSEKKRCLTTFISTPVSYAPCNSGMRPLTQTRRVKPGLDKAANQRAHNSP